MFRNYNYDARCARHTFEIHNLDLAIVNGLRRVILTDIPVVGFRGEGDASIRITKNNGPLHNEFMAHRIGMIPICFSKEEIEGFRDDKYMFALDVKNEKSDTMNVSTHQMTCIVREEIQADDGAENSNSEAPLAVVVKERPATGHELRRWFPADSVTKEPILITRLRPGESLAFEAWPVKSTAREHASFSPVSLCTHSFMEDEVAIAEQGITKILQKERTYIKNKYGDPIAFKFEMECETGLSPTYLMGKAMDVLIERIERIITELSNEPSDIVKRAWCDKVPGYEFTIEKEDDTIGHLLQSTMFDKYIRKEEALGTGENDMKLTYCGYICPHPLDYKMVFRMVLKDGENGKKETEDAYVSAFIRHCADVKDQIEAVRGDWSTFWTEANDTKK